MPKQLTIDDVVAHVEATEGWFLDGDRIRRDLRLRRPACPISSLDGRSSIDVDAVRRQRRIGPELSGLVITAADGWHLLDSEAADLRRRLLEAAKLAEVEDG